MHEELTARCTGFHTNDPLLSNVRWDRYQSQG